MVTSAQIEQLAEPLGFTCIGVAPAEPSAHSDFLHQWLADGRHGQMHYLARYLEKRIDPGKMLPGARSVICVADCHLSGDDDPPQTSGDKPHGRIARYAWGDDYHKIIKKRLIELADQLRQRWPEHDYRAAVDTAPVLEREHAARAGLGWIGKHTLLIHPQLGSYLLLGEIITTLPIESHEVITDHCGTCTRCIDACPTDCIRPYQLDAAHCISYLTIEHRDAIDPALHEPMGEWIAGCDICQEVCPFNGQGGRQEAAVNSAYAPRPPAPALSLLEVLNWTPDDRREAFTRSALKRIKLDMLKRNALIAAGNYLAKRDHPPLRERIEQMQHDENEPPMVRLTAQQVIARLESAET